MAVQRHWCWACRGSYAEASPLLVRGSWYAREVQRARFVKLGVKGMRTNAECAGRMLEDIARPDADGAALLRQAADTLQRSMRSDDLATQIRVYDQVLRNYGHGAGMDFFDKVVTPFVEHLKARGQVPAALQMLDRARRTLKVDTGSMLENEIKALDKKIRAPS